MKKIVICTAAVLSLAACGGGDRGGGGSSTTPPTTNTTPTAMPATEGAWKGTTPAAVDVRLVALENNQIWEIYGKDNGSAGFTVQGFEQGSILTLTANGAFTGSGKTYPINAAVTSGSFSGNAVANTSLNVVVTPASGASYSLSLVPMTASDGYEYTKAATLADLKGFWTGSAASTGTASSSAGLTVKENGDIDVQNAGCSSTGKVSPRDSGRNVYNVSLTFGAAPCVAPGMTLNGIAVQYTIAGTSTKQMIMLGIDSTKTAGALFLGQKVY